MDFFTQDAIAEAIAERQWAWTEQWHSGPSAPSTAEPWTWIEANHRMNFDLWHEEDIARRDDLPAERIRAAKRAIDRFNQARNDAVEKLDVCLLTHLPQPAADVPLHSETAGMIVDRLSILALKLYHMRIEAERPSAAEQHRATCTGKAMVLTEQRSDLARCLRELLGDMRAGRRQFRLYRQFKMYNDPSLNPELYGQGRGR
ncbi:MAG: DUF4254 domain-containing protein [Verrucomicrobia bacterium]|nr:MAG: DUF4254 domain-containing protein [Verrucomicrobiota bacterium]